MTAKEYLQRLYLLEDEIKCDQLELERVRALATSISGVDYSKEKVSGGYISNRPENLTIKIMSYEQKILDKISAAIEMREEIFDVINSLASAKERTVLKYRYIDFMDWYSIADKMHVTERTAFKYHGEALRNLKYPERSC